MIFIISKHANERRQVSKSHFTAAHVRLAVKVIPGDSCHRKFRRAVLFLNTNNDVATAHIVNVIYETRKYSGCHVALILSSRSMK